MLRQSSTSNENDVRMRNSRGGMPQGQGQLQGQGQGQAPDSPPSSPSQPTDTGARGCCFCWSVLPPPPLSVMLCHNSNICWLPPCPFVSCLSCHSTNICWLHPCPFVSCRVLACHNTNNCWSRLCPLFSSLVMSCPVITQISVGRVLVLLSLVMS